jgi:predicted RNA-binding Zn-ribbon protein involved in translation (DUF1610 family)
MSECQVCPQCGSGELGKQNNFYMEMLSDEKPVRREGSRIWIQCHKCGFKGPEMSVPGDAVAAWQRLPAYVESDLPF